MVGEMKSAYNFWYENVKRKNQDVKKILLKWILNKWCLRMWKNSARPE
jgi:hypothetical protein